MGLFITNPDVNSASEITGSGTPNNIAMFTTTQAIGDSNIQFVSSRVSASSGSMYVTLSAGTATAGTAPLVFTSGVSLTAAIAGAMEFTTDDLFFTITTGAARKRLLMADPVGGLTSTRVPFATTNGRLTDDANLTFANVSNANLRVGGAGNALITLASDGGRYLDIAAADNTVTSRIFATSGSTTLTHASLNHLFDNIATTGVTLCDVKVLDTSGTFRVYNASASIFFSVGTSGASATEIKMNLGSDATGDVMYRSSGGLLARSAGFNWNGTNRLSPTYVTLAAGTATAGTAPLVFTSGTFLTAPAVGSCEFLTDRLAFTTTTGTTRKDVDLLVYRGITTLRTLDGSDELVNITSGTFTVTLPTAVGFTVFYIVKNSGTGVITLATTSSQTIDGAASGTITLAQYDSRVLRSDGANWIVVA